MGGTQNSFTPDLTKRVPPSVFSRLKKATALVGTPRLSGIHLTKVRVINHQPTVSGLEIVMRCCSIFHRKGSSKTQEQAKRYSAGIAMDLFLVIMS